MRKKDGTWLDIAWAVYWSAQEQGLYCVAHDITIRKREEEITKASEQRLRNILQSLPVAVLLFDNGGKIEFVNEQMTCLCGYSAEEIPDMKLGELLPALSSFPQGTNLTESNLQEGQLKRQNAPDAMVEYSITTATLSGEPKHLLAMLDVTKRYEIEQAKRRFTALISHDLRTPITSLQLILAMFKDGILGELNERGQNFAEKGLTAASGLLVLINDLLDLEKMRQGKLKLDVKAEKAAKLVQDAYASVAAIATEKQIAIDVNVSETMCYADRRRIVQVIINLLANALKFSPPKSAIKVFDSIDESYLTISISDSGIGIPADKQESIFEFYAQVRHEDGFIGSGLGLPICKAIVEQHQGKIGVQSTEGQGSTFWFTMPRFPG